MNRFWESLWSRSRFASGPTCSRRYSRLGSLRYEKRTRGLRVLSTMLICPFTDDLYRHVRDRHRLLEARRALRLGHEPAGLLRGVPARALPHGQSAAMVFRALPDVAAQSGLPCAAPEWARVLEFQGKRAARFFRWAVSHHCAVGERRTGSRLNALFRLRAGREPVVRVAGNYVVPPGRLAQELDVVLERDVGRGRAVGWRRVEYYPDAGRLANDVADGAGCEFGASGALGLGSGLALFAKMVRWCPSKSTVCRWKFLITVVRLIIVVLFTIKSRRWK